MSEPRTAQFLIERKCPTGWPSIEVEWPQTPICCWVFLEKPTPECRSGGKSYTVVRGQKVTAGDGQEYWVDAFPGTYPIVCEHMGHLIE